MDWDNDGKKGRYDHDMDYFVFQEVNAGKSSKANKKNKDEIKKEDKDPLWVNVLYILAFLFILMIILGTGLGWLILVACFLYWLFK